MDRGTSADELHFDLLLIDDRRAVAGARLRDFRVAGTLAILGTAAQHGLLNLAEAFDRIKRTNFHYRQEIMGQLVVETSARKVVSGNGTFRPCAHN